MGVVLMNVYDGHGGFPKRNGSSILDNIRSIHAGFKLCGEPRNAILNVSDDLLLYLISLLRGETPQCPGSLMAEWRGLLSNLAPHWIQPLIYWQIMRLPPGSRPPAEIIDALRLKYLLSRARALIVAGQIRELSRALNGDNIRFLVLKGPALARTAYPDVALRSGSDIDILVLPDHVPRAKLALKKIGYDCPENQFDISRIYYLDDGFIHRDPSKNYLLLEVHWDLNHVSSIRNIDVADLFSRSVKVASDDYAFETLSPVDHLINSASHIGLKHDNDVRLSWIYDVSQLSKNLSLEEWHILQKRSVDCGVRIALERSLTMAQYWTGLQIPAEYSDFSRWPGPTKKELGSLSLINEGRRKAIRQFEVIFFGPGPMSDKVRVLIHRAFPTPSAMRKYKYTKPWLLPFYYVRRLFK